MLNPYVFKIKNLDNSQCFKKKENKEYIKVWKMLYNTSFFIVLPIYVEVKVSQLTKKRHVSV